MTDSIPDSNAADRRALLRNALEALEKMQQQLAASEQANREPIAVIGIGCRLPGGITTPEKYWELLAEGRDAVTQMPDDRWDVSRYFDPDPSAPGKIHALYGGFLEGIDKFDAGFFGISRREAESMDPQQRLLLEVSWEAIERAAIDASTLRGSRTGVFVGVTTMDYSRLTISQDPIHLDAYIATGSALNVTAGRLAYVLGLNGPAMAVDTACSSSLVGIHLACQGLRSRETDLALAGGVNVILLPEPFICFAKWGMMAPDGRCKTFDEAADGFVRGEGCGVLVLKRLSDALSAGDPIWALIKGSAVNQDGASSGLTVPNGRAQEAVMSEALKAAGMSAHQVNYIEAHGTGTRLGDPIEFEAIVNVLGAGRTRDNPLRVGSVKTNIGHLESASGIAGLIKVILSLNHRAIPPHIHFKKLNPQINIGDAAIEIPTAITPWTHYADHPLAAGVSSFGFSGTNAHVIVEEPPKQDILEASVREREIVCLSARTRSALEQRTRDVVEFIKREPGSSLADISYASTIGRRHFSHRLALVAEDIHSVRRQMEDWLEGKHPQGVWNTAPAEGQAKGVAFLFTGQGSQYPGMASTLYQTQPVFRKIVDRCADILKPLVDRPLQEILFTEGQTGNAINETVYTQPALFVVEYALAEMLQEWGILPSIVMGHSVGEYVAACVAGVFSLEDGLKLIAARARLMTEKTERGVMAAVFAGKEAIASTIAELTDDINIAAINGPENVVISGRSSSIEGVLAKLTTLNIRFQKLPVSHAFHSPLMEPMLDAFYQVASEVVFSTPTIALISNIDGKLISSDMVLDAAYWQRHIREPVQFADSIQTLIKEECDCWLEVGPHPVLLSMARQIEPNIKAELLPTLRRQQPDWAQLTESLAALYSRGWNIGWKAFHAGRSHSSVQLPTYPFEREKFWVSPQTQVTKTLASAGLMGTSGHPLLGSRIDLPGDEGIFIWQAALDMKRCSFLLDHCIQGSAIFPATAYIEMVLAAAAETQPAEIFVLHDLSFQKPLLLTQEMRRTLQLWMRKGPDGAFEVRVFSRDAPCDKPERVNAAWTLHMTGTVSVKGQDNTETDREKFDMEFIRSRCPEEIQGSMFYESQKERGNQWGPCFQGIHTLWRGDGEALSQIHISPQLEAVLGDYRFHPAVADFCGHVLAATLPVDDTGHRSGAFVGGGIAEVRVYGSPVGRRLWSHARLRQDGQTAENVLIGDVRVWDENENLISETLGAQLWYLDHKQSDSTAEVRRWMHEIYWVPDGSEPCSDQKDLSSQCWIIFSDTGGVGETLQRHVNSWGGIAFRILRGKQYRQEGESLWTIRPDSSEDFDRCFEDIRGLSHKTFSKVVHLWNLDSPVPDEMSAEQLQYWQVLGCGSALYAIQSLARMEQARVRFFLVTAGAQTTSDSPAPISPAQASVWGLGRTAAIEHAQFWGGLIDLDPATSPETSALQLLQTMESGSAEDQVIFRDGHRLVARLQPLKIDDPDSRPLKIHDNSSYLITGGLGGIGFETARWLGSRGARHLIVVGRTSLPGREAWDQTNSDSPLGRRIERIGMLEGLGMEVTYFCGDISDGHVFDLIHDALADGKVPSIRGIVHAAGVMQYEPLAGQNAERLLEVMKAKVIGGWLLHQRFLDQPIDLFILFSSSSSMLNSPFMGAYAAANSFLDALAAYRRRIGFQALGISWGTWSETGMVFEGARAANAPRSLLKGVGTISNREGMEALELLIRCNAVHSGVMPMDWHEWERAYPAFASRPFFESLMSPDEDAPDVGRTDDPSNRQTIRAAATGNVDRIVDYLTLQIAFVLKTSPDRVAANVALPTLGFDSLMAVEIKNRIENDLQVDMPMVSLLEGQTINQLSNALSKKLAANNMGDTGSQAEVENNRKNTNHDDQNWEEGVL